MTCCIVSAIEHFLIEMYQCLGDLLVAQTAIYNALTG